MGLSNADVCLMDKWSLCVAAQTFTPLCALLEEVRREVMQ